MLLIRWTAAIVLLVAGSQSSGWCAGSVRDQSPELFISVKDDRVTARIERASLRLVLAELHRQTGVRVQFTDPTDDGLVWKVFTDVQLVDALYRLLEGRSFALYYDAAPAAAGKAAQPALVVRILPPPAAALVSERRNTSVPNRPALVVRQPSLTPDDAANPAEPQPGSSPERSPQATLDDLGQAMVDPDERVRARAQAMFDQALTKQAQPAASMPTSRR